MNCELAGGSKNKTKKPWSNLFKLYQAELSSFAYLPSNMLFLLELNVRLNLALFLAAPVSLPLSNINLNEVLSYIITTYK